MKANLIVICLLINSSLLAAGNFPLTDISTDGLRFGQHVLGPKVDKSGLKNKVVVVEFWGIHCPPCIASLPKLQGWHEKYQDQGLVLIGIHAQGPNQPAIKAACEKAKVNFTVYDSGDLAKAKFTGIPHMVVFDHTGKAIYRGSPFSAWATIETALKAAPAGILEGRKLVKLNSVATRLKSGGSIGQVFGQVKQAAKSRDETTKQEAEFLLGQFQKAFDSQLAAAKALRTSDPSACQTAVDKLAKDFSGSDYAKITLSLKQELQKDSAFQKELQAYKLLNLVRQADAKINIRGDLTDRNNQRPFMREINIIVSYGRAIKQRYKDSKAAVEAETIAKKYGMEL